MVNEIRQITSKIQLSDFFFKTDIVHVPNNYDSFARGLITQPIQEQDKYFTEEVLTYYILFFGIIIKI